MKTIFLAVLATSLLACSSHDATHDASTAHPVCDAIMARCHAFSSNPGAPHDCHVLALANDGTACRAQQATCFAACVSTVDAGATDVGATDDVATDTPADIAADTMTHGADAHH